MAKHLLVQSYAGTTTDETYGEPEDIGHPRLSGVADTPHALIITVASETGQLAAHPMRKAHIPSDDFC